MNWTHISAMWMYGIFLFLLFSAMASVYDFNSDEDGDLEFEGFTSRDLPLQRHFQNDAASDVSSVETADLTSLPDEDGSDLDVSSGSGGNSQSLQDLDVEDIDVEWSSKDFELVQRHYFVQQSGPHLPPGFDKKSSPLEYVQLFFLDSLVQEITEHTNAYALHSIRKKRQTKPGFQDRLWPEDGSANVTTEEMRAYLGLLILFGVSPRPQYKDYWSSDVFIGNEGVKSVMSLRRFEKITQYFHVSDREREPVRGSPDYDRLYKIKPVMTVVEGNCKALYAANEHQAIDEDMIAY